jgi:hypothetical protein
VLRQAKSKSDLPAKRPDLQITAIKEVFRWRMIVRPGRVIRKENVVSDGLVIKQPGGSSDDADHRPSVLNELDQNLAAQQASAQGNLY